MLLSSFPRNHIAVALTVPLTTGASAAGPGGWDHLGTGGTATTASLNGAVRAFNADTPGVLYVGGAFTAAGGVAGADHIAAWDGTNWSALGNSAFTGDVNAIESVGGRVFAGGTFQNAGGDANAIKAAKAVATTN